MIPIASNPSIDTSPTPDANGNISDNRHHHNTYGQTDFQKVRPSFQHDDV